MWGDKLNPQKGDQELAENSPTPHAPLNNECEAQALHTMPKTLKLTAEEVAYLLKKVSRAKFGLDENEDRIMVFELREKLQGIQNKTEPMFPPKPEENDGDPETD